MKQGISIAALFIVLQYGLLMFIFPQSIIQSQPSGHWLTVVLGWLLQGVLLRLLIGGFKESKEDLLLCFLQTKAISRFIWLWLITISNVLVITIIIRGHSQLLKMLFLPNTPIWVLMALLLFSSLCISYAGRNSLLRLSILVGIFGLPLIIISLASTYGNLSLNMISPLVPTFSFLGEAKILPLFFIFSHTIGVIGFFGPLSNVSKRWLWGAWSVSLFFYLIIVYIPLGMFGHEGAAPLRYPLIIVLDSIRVNWFFFDRLSLFYVMAVLLSTLMNVTGLLWLTRAMASRSSRLTKWMTNPITVSVLVLILALLIVNMGDLEKLSEWGAPARFGLVLAIAIAGAYYRRQARHRR
ncbi:GerAB/ArcD/ProY family transporter [Paenibacillus lignilyticus]|uniref:GerAB/ArcD/ProY family transporter n=1 Tax=Paenibacillus lignilyticus TaxID=1172615 RepID=A0ABS5CA51_9BACL|nr:GerAB/ArcD/ProY family transporter [Paenibacillus lignilyticus]MBP3961948.1 GerAB/ArcD/ProY family transporter [Paenibacillus lignilyticus]